MKLTPEQILLKSQLQKFSVSELITNILKFKLAGYTHKQIADKLGYSTSYINLLSRQINQA